MWNLWTHDSADGGLPSSERFVGLIPELAPTRATLALKSRLSEATQLEIEAGNDPAYILFLAIRAIFICSVRAALFKR